MIKILSGEMAIELHLQFLIRNNNTDLMILKNTKVKQTCHKMNKLENVFDGELFMEMQNLSLPCQMNRRLSLNALLHCPLTLFSPLLAGCSSKFGLSHSHSNSQLFHAHGNHKWPVPEVTVVLSENSNLFPVWHRDVWRCTQPKWQVFVWTSTEKT